jgi:hypothetical protein
MYDFGSRLDGFINTASLVSRRRHSSAFGVIGRDGSNAQKTPSHTIQIQTSVKFPVQQVFRLPPNIFTL